MHRVCSCPKALGLWAAAPQQLLGACAHGGPLVCAWHAISGVWVLLKSIVWAWLSAVVPVVCGAAKPLESARFRGTQIARPRADLGCPLTNTQQAHTQNCSPKHEIEKL